MDRSGARLHAALGRDPRRLRPRRARAARGRRSCAGGTACFFVALLRRRRRHRGRRASVRRARRRSARCSRRSRPARPRASRCGAPVAPMPLVVLALAVLLGLGVERGCRRHCGATRGRCSRFAVAVARRRAVVRQLPGARSTGRSTARTCSDRRTSRRTGQDAAAALDAGDHQTRVLELPGSDFASYTWGNTVDPITPGLMDRPYVARELIPCGTARPSADLLNALDRRDPGGHRSIPNGLRTDRAAHGRRRRRAAQRHPVRALQPGDAARSRPRCSRPFPGSAPRPGSGRPCRICRTGRTRTS